MKVKRIIIVLILFLFVGCLCAHIVNTFQPNRNIDMVTINRIVKEVSNNWDSLKKGNYKDFNYPFSVLSLDNSILFRSSSNATDHMNEAIKNGDAILDIEQNDKVVGKIIITTNMAATFKPMQTILSRIILAFFSLFTLFAGCYFLYLHKKIIQPFRNLEKFAKEVANGNLDFTLELNKDNIFGSFTQSFDIMREQLKTAKHEEFLANKSKKELVATLSHDIKTPVTSIKLTSELLMVTTEDKKIKDKLETINLKAEQINLLVTDLFDATLNDLENLRVTPVETYSSVLKTMISKADCYNTITMSPIPDCMLYIDPLRLGQVISNIIYNSYKYANTPITIDFCIKDSYLEMQIQDYGNGVEEEELPLLFNKFYRGKNAATKSGSGLGLYICKKLLEQMESEIYCNNNEQGFITQIFLRLA